MPLLRCVSVDGHAYHSLTYVAYICVSGLHYQRWFESWFVTFSAPSHNMNQCWFVGNLNSHRNKQNTTILIWENAFEIVVCKMTAILSRFQGVIACLRRLQCKLGDGLWNQYPKFPMHISQITITWWKHTPFEKSCRKKVILHHVWQRFPPRKFGSYLTTGFLVFEKNVGWNWLVKLQCFSKVTDFTILECPLFA